MKREPKRTNGETGCPFFNTNASGAAITLLLIVVFCLAAAKAEAAWQRKSSSTGDMPTPNDGKEQTCCLILDIDQDGDLDILLKPYNHKTPRMDILLNGGGNVAGSGGEKS